MGSGEEGTCWGMAKAGTKAPGHPPCAACPMYPAPRIAPRLAFGFCCQLLAFERGQAAAWHAWPHALRGRERERQREREEGEGERAAGAEAAVQSKGVGGAGAGQTGGGHVSGAHHVGAGHEVRAAPAHHAAVAQHVAPAPAPAPRHLPHDACAARISARQPPTAAAPGRPLQAWRAARSTSATPAQPSKQAPRQGRRHCPHAARRAARRRHWPLAARRTPRSNERLPRNAPGRAATPSLAAIPKGSKA